MRALCAQSGHAEARSMGDVEFGMGTSFAEDSSAISTGPKGTEYVQSYPSSFVDNYLVQHMILIKVDHHGTLVQTSVCLNLRILPLY